MKQKEVKDFTKEDKELLDTVAVNYVIAQADGFQMGYAEAINDFTEYIMDYWQGSDDKPQKSVLDALVDMGVELGKRKQVAEKNVEEANRRGYEGNYRWDYQERDKPFKSSLRLFVKIEHEPEKAESERQK